MDPEAVKGLVVLVIIAIAWSLWTQRYPMKVCPTCNGDGREFEEGTKNFRICTQCHGYKAIPR